MNEKQFENKIKNFLKFHDIWYFKVWGGGYSKAGIPDLICCIGGKFVALELKSDTGKPTELQKYNIKKIKESGGIGLILYPDDFEDFKDLVNGLEGR